MTTLKLPTSRGERGLLPRLAYSYLLDFPFQRGKGLLLRLLSGHIRIETRFGSRIVIRNLLEYHQKVLFADDASWEPDVQRVVQALLPPGGVFLDIGANLGFFSLMASKRVGPSGVVHSFEPVPAQYSHLVENLRLNAATNVTAQPFALSDTDGSMDFFVSKSWNSGVHSLFALPDAVKTKVQVHTLDGYLASANVPPPTLIKMDVEGAETLVLRGAAGLLKSTHRPFVVLEADDSHARRAGSSLLELRQLFAAARYTVVELLVTGGVREPVWPPTAASNWLASPSERLGELPDFLVARAG